jgi:Lar family restriction alleviation protein
VSAPLKPCPFCGGEAELRDPHAAFSHLAAVFCNECEIRGQLSVGPELAIDFWNTRETPNPSHATPSPEAGNG